MIFLFILHFWLPLLPPYSAVVVDARTNQPLAGVVIRDLKSALTATTDNAGRFSLPQVPGQLQLNLLGYAPLQLAQATGSPPDTLRLLPRSMVLGDVVVRPGKVTLLSTGTAKGAHLARGLSPGQALAMFLAPPAQSPAGQASVLDQIQLFLLDRPLEGRIRVRIVEALPGLSQGSPARPGPADFLPEAAVFSLAQLQALPRGQLTVDVSKYSLLMPPQGIFIVVECLPTNPADQVVAVTQAPDSKHPTQIVLAPDPQNLTTAHTVPSDKYPAFEGRRVAEEEITWLRLSQKQPWRRQQGEYQATIRAEIKLYTY